MAGKKNKPEITRANITRHVKAAANAGRVIITNHASEKALARGITDKQLREVAKGGVQVQTEPAEADDLNTKTRMRKRVAGDDVTIIATVITTRGGESALIITDWK
jgi:hypothetical protein